MEKSLRSITVNKLLKYTKLFLKLVFVTLYFNLNIFMMKNIKGSFLNLFLRLFAGGMMVWNGTGMAASAPMLPRS